MTADSNTDHTLINSVLNRKSLGYNQQSFLKNQTFNTMSQINVYLTFDGNCRNAMTFYHKCLGGELEIIPFEGSAIAETMPKEMLQQVMHSRIKKGELVLMASDGGRMKGELIKGNTVNLSLNCTSEAEIDEYFSKLSEGGSITMPLEDRFWGAKFGMLTDKFGTDWMLNFDRKKR
jgi:PhnB protein